VRRARLIAARREILARDNAGLNLLAARSELVSLSPWLQTCGGLESVTTL